ncbi:MAG: fumarylacetoacetate hydrolase family protein [Actinobacteria bacterium]|nr:fumarylacetoacetate hydrolase family protein [Actinomycetota bacterium]
MRVGTASAGGGRVPVIERDGELWPIDGAEGRGLRELIAASQPLEPAGEPLADGRLLAPLRPGKIVAIGLNYLDHVRESGVEPPPAPLVFTKFTTSVVGPGEPIRIDGELAERVDWEVELAVVIGKTMRRVTEEDALDGVFGYTAANDVSARDLQFGDGQWVRGKSLDTFCPLGPVVITADEVPDPQALSLGTVVNGETVQDSSTAEMVFGVAELLAYCSRSFTLEPGDILLTGTPWGCGEFMKPRRSLHPGDLVEVSVESIGTLSNPVESL